jgi:hypothetical protein
MEIIAVVEELLSELFAGKVRIGPPEPLTSSKRSNVNRFFILEGPQHSPKSVIVKQTVKGLEVNNTEPTDGPVRKFLNEWAGLRFLTENAGDASPASRFYAGDRERGLLVLEDLGARAHLDQVLLSDDPASAEAMLVALAATLGRMQALTIGKQAEFEQICRDLQLSVDGVENDNGESVIRTIHLMANTVGVKPVAGVDAELRGLMKSLTEPGPFLAYIHGDPCPDNCLWTDAGLKLVDYEYGRYGHALHDGVYGRIHFPSCWCVNRLPDHVPLKMEAAYRDELIKGCPEAADDKQFYRAVVEVCAYHVIERHHDILELLKSDDNWGLSTIRQRALLRFDIFADLTEEYSHLMALGKTIRAIAKRLRAVWPSEANAMLYYPAFRTR